MKLTILKLTLKSTLNTKISEIQISNIKLWTNFLNILYDFGQRFPKNIRDFTLLFSPRIWQQNMVGLRKFCSIFIKDVLLLDLKTMM